MATDYFLELKNIEGESKDDAHAKQIDVLSWSWGASQSGTLHAGGGGGAGKVNAQDMSFAMYLDKAAPKLFTSIATGEHIPKATLTCRKAGGEQQEYLIIVMEDCLVTSYQTSGAQGDERPMLNVTLNFAKMEVQYKPQKEDGSLDAQVKAGYNFQTNKKL